MINSIFNTETNILETEFINDITALQVINYIVAFKDNTSYPRKLKSVIDATQATFKFSFRDLKSFNAAKANSLVNYDSVMIAIIISNSTTAALSVLYEAIANNKKYKFKVFSSEEGAINWLESFRI
ncbi:hypothetical protein APS56_00300 [Pseudalgibacter alginicilyticus]|uniref:STAS/SEC14 domain-containing protein n=1 Tax=Pseudalgibacter alginicilyticus TaxID=1736674 RepID=A0A0P0D542_9FLAO|nr:hypothetical protein [Pseudalgibacter alginicilyticus]ALJ03681.1 hypothetical protein APS56_00300 [Pseudalgibacter alginicilyticus]